MAALRGLLQGRRRCRALQGLGGAEGRRLWGSDGGEGAVSGWGAAAAAGAAGGALAWLLCQRLYGRPGERLSEERRLARGGGGGGSGEAGWQQPRQGRPLLPLPIAAAAKETTVGAGAGRGGGREARESPGSPAFRAASPGAAGRPPGCSSAKQVRGPILPPLF